jgi:hypothetical protein
VKRFKKILKIGALVLGLLLVLLLIANAIFISITGSRLEKHLAAIRAAGDPVTLAELKRPLPPPEQNAATYLSRAREAEKAFDKETDPVVRSEPARPIEEQMKAVRAGLAAYPGIIPLMQQAAACPDCNLDLPYDANPSEFIDSLMKSPQWFRNSASILSWQARLLRHEGKLDDAMRTCLISFRLSRQLQREPPLLISYLVVIACRAMAVGDANAILRAGPISNAVRVELDKELAFIEALPGLGQVLKNERALAISHFGTVIPVGWFNRGIANAWECNYLDTCNEQIELVARPYTEAMAAAAKKTIPTQFDIFSFLGLPAILKVREAWHRMQAQTRCLRIMNAMQQKDVWKDNEIDLSNLGLPRETITDPYDGSRLKLKKVKGEWIIYSVGANLKDDGGNLESNIDVNDVGLGPIAANHS